MSKKPKLDHYNRNKRDKVVNALSDAAKAFYERIGFDPSPLDPMTLMITLADLKASLH